MMQWFPKGDEFNVNSSIMLAFIFVVASFLLVPRTLLCLAAGAAFGLQAILVILPSTTFGGLLAFLAARHLFAARLQIYLAGRPQLRKISVAVDEEGWRVVALLRFASPVPNAIQNYVFGLTRIGLLPFSLATVVFTIPQVVLYVYLGAAGRAVLLDQSMSTLNSLVLGIGLMSVVVTVLLVVRRIRRDKALTRV